MMRSASSERIGRSRWRTIENTVRYQTARIDGKSSNHSNGFAISTLKTAEGGSTSLKLVLIKGLDVSSMVLIVVGDCVSI